MLHPVKRNSSLYNFDDCIFNVDNSCSSECAAAVEVVDCTLCVGDDGSVDALGGETGWCVWAGCCGCVGPVNCDDACAATVETCVTCNKIIWPYVF